MTIPLAISGISSIKRSKNYEEYLAYKKTIKFVHLNETNRKLSKCSRWYWYKNYKCKHMISISHRLQCFEYLAAHKSIKIGRKRKAGSPKMTAKTL